MYLVLTPQGLDSSDFVSNNGPDCAAHGNDQYTAIAWESYNTDAPPYNDLTYPAGDCGEYIVNGPTNGTLDGATINAGHEIAEMMTDLLPQANTEWDWFQVYTDSNGTHHEEIGDKCSWYNLGDVTMPNGQTFAMQPLWSNASSSCVMNYGVAPTPTPQPTPTPVPTPVPSPTIQPTINPCRRPPCPQGQVGYSVGKSGALAFLDFGTAIGLRRHRKI